MNGIPPAAQVPAKKQRKDDDKGDGSKSLVSMTRRRVWRACEACRRKKIKCDGTEPVCGQCTQTNTTCTWMQTRDRAALSRQYVQELENRLIRLESVLAQVAPSVDLSELPNGPIPVEHVAEQQSVPVASTSSSSSGHYPATGIPALNAISNGGNISVSAATAGRNPAPPSQYQYPILGATDGPRGLVKVEVADNSDEFVAEQMGTLALDDHGHLRWIGGSSTMSLIEAFRNFSTGDADHSSPSPPDSAATATPTPNPPSANLLYFPPSMRFGKVRALPGIDEVEYPPVDLANKLVEAYFAQFHHTLPVLDSLSFRAKYKRLMEGRRAAEQNGTASEPPTKSDAGFISVVFAVYAVAARFVDDDRLNLSDGEEHGEDTGGMGMVYYERAMILYYIGATATQLAHVQAFVLLSSFLTSLNCLPQAWLLCGQAVRIAQDLGLHRSPKHLVMSPVNKETRRKVWWCVYGLDRMLAVALGRPLGTEDSDCDVELPIPVDDINLSAHFQAIAEAGGSPSLRNLPGFEPASTSLMAGFNALTQLHVIVGKILRTVYAVDAVDSCKENQKLTQARVEGLDKELTTWCEQLPSTFKSDPKSSQQISLGAILCSSYYSALITLHRNFLPTKRKGAPNPNWASVPKAVFASRSCILLSVTTKDSIPPSHHLAFFVQALFGAAVIILLCARFATVESAARTASDEVNTALVCLGTLEKAWPGAKKCKELLEELVEAAKTDMRVKVPGVGRPGSVNGMVAPPPPGVDRVQTVYSSYKRAAPPEGADAAASGDEETEERLIKMKPRRSKSHARRPSQSTSPAGRNRSGRSQSTTRSGASSGAGNVDMDVDYFIPESSPSSPVDAYATQRTFNNPGSSTANFNRFSHGRTQSLSRLSLDATTPANILATAQANQPGGSSSLQSFGQTLQQQHFAVPHDWLPPPSGPSDSFSLSQFNPGPIFSNLPQPSMPSSSNNSSTISSKSQSSPVLTPQMDPLYQYTHYDMSPQQSVSGPPAGGDAGPANHGTFQFTSAEIPFSGFDFLQNFSTSPTSGGVSASAIGGGGGGMGGFGAGDVAAWQNFVETGLFNDAPDQPFVLSDGHGDEPGHIGNE
ncbi:hypothetical protein FRB94_012240 [Tulasnella sp. JGI-2019a]|nr:hypothetical protein FRB94_012240 [Tulasnella sp. JGI-2019a]